MNFNSSQDSQYEDQLLNEYMNNYEKEQMANKQDIESCKDSFSTCSSGSQISDNAFSNEKDNYNTWKDFGTQNHEPIQSTWSFNQSESKDEQPHWHSQQY